MTEKQVILSRINQTVELLDSLAEKFVFLGGSVVPILVTDAAAHDARPTKDMDVIVRVASSIEYDDLKEKLEDVGFIASPTKDEECRFTNGTLLLDVIPSEKEILGFCDEWCKQALDNFFEFNLFDKTIIKVVTAPVFLCTKLSAYVERRKDYKRDLEDIITVVDGRGELLLELFNASGEVKKYISDNVKILFADDLKLKLGEFMPLDPAGAAREPIVLSRLMQMVSLENEN